MILYELLKCFDCEKMEQSILLFLNKDEEDKDENGEVIAHGSVEEIEVTAANIIKYSEYEIDNFSLFQDKLIIQLIDPANVDLGGSLTLLLPADNEE